MLSMLSGVGFEPTIERFHGCVDADFGQSTSVFKKEEVSFPFLPSRDYQKGTDSRMIDKGKLLRLPKQGF